MLLVIDCGNTNVVFAVFEDDNIIGQWRLSSDEAKTVDEYGVAITSLIKLSGISIGEIDSCIISSVVPSLIPTLKTLCKKFFKVTSLVTGENAEIDIKVKVDRKNEIGDDRLLNAIAIYNKYGGNVLIVDFGTATTFDIIDGEGAYIGGVIAPGAALTVDALQAAAARLPKVEIKPPEKLIGETTINAMQSGVYWGYVGLVEKIVSKIKHQSNVDLKVIATGGFATLFGENIKYIDIIDSNLTLQGLQLVYKLNKDK
jgi:type III pantothenate kinase